MLNQQQRQAASDMLWDYWQRGRCMPGLPAELIPADRNDGYAVQALLERRSTGPLYGWKIAATSQAGQAHIGVDGPLAGRLLRERARNSGALLSISSNQMKVAEPEFAFRMARDLAPRARPYSEQEVLAAVDTLHPAIEIPDSRYQDFARVGAAQLIADDACANLFVLGAATRADWRSINLAEHKVKGTVTSGLQRDGRGANVLGDPRTALTWLANELSSLRITLAAGQVVTTGTCMAPLPMGAGDLVMADFGELGSVDVRFSP